MEYLNLISILLFFVLKNENTQKSFTTLSIILLYNFDTSKTNSFFFLCRKKLFENVL